ncbi:hypothetical protein LMG6871_00959 [Ralstonia edaphis]|uniref:FkbM family methyltransferase n=1 Tax=Ralstonia edaphi TaxID=3058599 RepID=UPI0028F5F7DC|nr:FkbM family methyltransferase [Ralstonia sp. LMG 6871]CAJ0713981.1 hypothetical protein LMG6871_00959 [Ralstonia sp. LMG 6871]
MITSYAQNFEDVMLWRALSHVEHGFYIDIGAQDPLIDSVSLMFYEQGWRGIHVEPTPHYAEALRHARPEDIVVQAAIGKGPSVLPFFEIPGTGISTCDPNIAEQHRQRGFDVRQITVSCLPLSAILAACPGQDIHWLKIDVEGFELQVLSTWGNSTIRPWIVVVESTLPLTQIDTHGDWETHLIEYGYEAVYFDGLNRYYVSESHPELKTAFDTPPNVFDNFSLNGTASAPFHYLIQEQFRIKTEKLTTHFEEKALALQQEHSEREQALQASLEAAHREFRQQEQDFQHQAEALAAQVSAARKHLEESLREIVHREQAILSELLAAQKRADSERQTREEATSAIWRASLERESVLRAEVDAARKDSRDREGSFREYTQTLLSQIARSYEEQADLRREMIEREREITSQLVASQQQIDRQRTDQDRAVEELRRAHSERENFLQSQLQQAQDAIQRIERERQQIEKDRAALAVRARSELEDVLRSLANRERELDELRHRAVVQEAEKNQMLAKTTLAIETFEQEIAELKQREITKTAEHNQQITETSRALAIREYEIAELRERVTANETKRAQMELELEQRRIERERDAQREIEEHAQRANMLDLAYAELEMRTAEQQQAYTQCFAAYIQLKARLTGRAWTSKRKVATWLFAPVTLAARQLAHEQVPTSIYSALLSFEQVSRKITMDISPIRKVNFQPEFTIQPDGNYDLEDFYPFFDRKFVRFAYLAILRREPDPEGETYYVNRLRAGVSKHLVLWQLAKSPEAKGHNTKIARLRRAVLVSKVCNVPIIGNLLQTFLFLSGIGRHLQDLRALENHIIRMGEEILENQEESLNRIIHLHRTEDTK